MKRRCTLNRCIMNSTKNSDFCIVDLIDCKTHKIVDYEIVIKNLPRHPSSYIGSSKEMETEGSRRIFARWKNNKNVKYIIDDLDSSVSNALRESGWKVTELYDVNQ